MKCAQGFQKKRTFLDHGRSNKANQSEKNKKGNLCRLKVMLLARRKNIREQETI